MKNYTKQITAFAVLSLIAYSANAQSATFNWDQQNNDTGPTSGMTIAPADGVAATTLISNVTGANPGTPITDSTSIQGVTTITTEEQLGQAAPLADYTKNDVVGGGTSSVVINNEGITLNQVETTANAVVVNRFVTEVVTVTPGDPTTTVITWTAELRDASGTVIAGSQSTYNDDPLSPNFGTKTDATDDLEAFVTTLAADDTSLLSATTPTPGTPTGGNLTVGGNLAVGAIGDVEQAVIDTAQAVTVNTDDITTLNGDVDVVGSVANSIAGALDDTGVSENGIVGVIEKRADGTVKLGENSFIFDDTTASHVLTADGAATEIVLGGDAPATGLVTESVNIRVANNLDVDGAANVDGVLSLGDSGNGAVADVASAINGNTAANVLTQADVDQNEADSDAADLALGSRIDNNASAIANNSSRIASNKEDIEQNTRGIAMVAALQHTTVLPGMNNAFDLSAAHFEGETGLALNYARRINENVQINFGAASTTDFDESVIKAGIGVQW